MVGEVAVQGVVMLLVSFPLSDASDEGNEEKNEENSSKNSNQTNRASRVERGRAVRYMVMVFGFDFLSRKKLIEFIWRNLKELCAYSRESLSLGLTPPVTEGTQGLGPLVGGGRVVR